MVLNNPDRFWCPTDLLLPWYRNPFIVGKVIPFDKIEKNEMGWACGAYG